MQSGLPTKKCLTARYVQFYPMKEEWMMYMESMTLREVCDALDVSRRAERRG